MPRDDCLQRFAICETHLSGKLRSETEIRHYTNKVLRMNQPYSVFSIVILN